MLSSTQSATMHQSPDAGSMTQDQLIDHLEQNYFDLIRDIEVRSATGCFPRAWSRLCDTTSDLEKRIIIEVLVDCAVELGNKALHSALQDFVRRQQLEHSQPPTYSSSVSIGMVRPQQLQAAAPNLEHHL